MNWDDLQLLLAFHTHGSLKGAATATGVHLSTVSRRLRLLEGALGTSLVEHVGGRLTLTPHGHRALDAANAMRDHSDALLREILGQDDRLEGVIKVGLLDVCLRYHGDMFEDFINQHPGVQFEFLTHGARRHSLTRREVDVVMRVSVSPDDLLVGRGVLPLAYAVFAHDRLLEAGKLEMSTAPWLSWHGDLHAEMTEAWLARHVDMSRIRARVVSVCAMIDLARAGVGACLLPIPYGTAAGLVQCSDPLPGFETTLWVLTHHDLKHNARVRAFSAHVFDFLAPHRRQTS